METKDRMLEDQKSLHQKQMKLIQEQVKFIKNHYQMGQNEVSLYFARKKSKQIKKLKNLKIKNQK